MSRAKPAEREAARAMRAEGRPIKQIARGLSVSPASVHLWTRDIELTPTQIAQNRRGSGGPQDPAVIRRRAAAWAARCRAFRVQFQAEGREAARNGDLLHLTGCMLYWAEGSKNRNRVTLVNSDPHMVATFKRFLTEALGVERRRIVVTLNVYTNNGLTIEEIEDRWLGLLELPRACFRKHTLNHMPTSSSGHARGRLPYGVCSLTVNSTRIVQHIYGAIQEYGGFEEPAWLDG
jgi:hypothetical protein